MTVAQIKKTAVSLKEDDRLFMLHYLKHLLRANTQANRRELSAYHRDIEGGRKVTLDQVKRLDKAFRSEGL